MLFKLRRMMAVAIVAGLLGIAYYLMLYPFVVHQRWRRAEISNTLPGGEAAGKRSIRNNGPHACIGLGTYMRTTVLSHTLKHSRAKPSSQSLIKSSKAR